jgi:hypothetical protein
VESILSQRLIYGLMNEDFPADIKQFIADHIDTVAQLELLLLLRGDPKSWTPQEAGQALYSAADVIALQLADLQAKGLLVLGPVENSYVYRPQRPELAGLVDRLADLYRERRVAVITAVYTKPIDKIKSFADAFRLRKDK